MTTGGRMAAGRHIELSYGEYNGSLLGELTSFWLGNKFIFERAGPVDELIPWKTQEITKPLEITNIWWELILAGDRRPSGRQSSYRFVLAEFNYNE